ncbi:MAG TPA: HAD family hydrolase [Candidatus Saccharimonadales bacterium]|nr:HAD family hydrolase [Candidatus Saccharimonadales bacterium]
MIKLIIFDWDDVFTLGSKEGYYACYHAALKGVGVKLDPEEEDRRIKAKWGAGGEKQLEYLLREHPELVKKAFEIYQEHAHGKTFVDCLSIIPGTQDFLKRISKKYILAIATGAHPKVLHDFVMPKFNIPDVFAQIFTIYDLDDMSHAKPHPYIVQKIMETQGVKPEETILVGDAESDMQMAWNAGVKPIAVLTGHLNRKEAEKLGVKHIIDNVTSLELELSNIG